MERTLIGPLQELMRGVCFGCGSENPHGHQIKSYWDGETATLRWTPRPHHTAGPGMLYGGVIASLFDCHLAMAVVARVYEFEDREIGAEPRIHYVTANLNVDYVKPSPIEGPVDVTASVDAIEGRKAWASGSLSVRGIECARASALYIRVSGV